MVYFTTIAVIFTIKNNEIPYLYRYEHGDREI